MAKYACPWCGLTAPISGTNVDATWQKHLRLCAAEPPRRRPLPSAREVLLGAMFGLALVGAIMAVDWILERYVVPWLVAPAYGLTMPTAPTDAKVRAHDSGFVIGNPHQRMEDVMSYQDEQKNHCGESAPPRPSSQTIVGQDEYAAREPFICVRGLPGGDVELIQWPIPGRDGLRMRILVTRELRNALIHELAKA